MFLFRMSFEAGILVIVILLVRKITVNLIPRKTFLFLWWIVIIRLLIPWFVSSEWSIYSILRGYFVNHRAVNYEMYSGHFSSDDLNVVISGIWKIGMICTLLYFAVHTLLCYCSLRYSVSIDDNPIIDRWKASYKLLRPVKILASSQIGVPCTTGFFRPCIFLPSRMNLKDDSILKYVLPHEYVHIYRCDILCKFFAIAAVCAHWFNPFAWFMLVCLNHDMEFSCDEYVMNYYGLNNADKKQYVLSLLSFASASGNELGLNSFFGRNILEERIASIMKLKKQSGVTRAFALVLVVCVVLFFGTSANAAENNSEKEQHRTASMEVLQEDVSPRGRDVLVSESANSEFEKLHRIHNLIRDMNLRSEEYRREMLIRLIDMTDKGE